MLLEIEGIKIVREDRFILEDFSLSLDLYDIGVLLGPSGCGKTTLLRSIAGFHQLSEGRIVIGGVLASSKQVTVRAGERGVGMVFQDSALFPHLNVAQNILFGMAGMMSEKKEHLEMLLDLLELHGLDQRYPSALSGGQQQRVAIAMAMAIKPDLILMDEPFSSLDPDLRYRLNLKVREVLKQQKITGLLVTHDQNEAFIMADKLGVINHSGALMQWGASYDVYHKPSTLSVARFIGEGVFLESFYLGDGVFENVLGQFQAGQQSCNFKPKCGQFYKMLVRPDDVHFDANGSHVGVIESKIFRGSTILYGICVSGKEMLLALFPSHYNLSIKSTVSFTVQMHHVVIFES